MNLFAFYTRDTAGSGGTLVSREEIEVTSVYATSEDSQICDVVLYDSRQKNLDSIAAHVAAEENATNQLTFDPPLLLRNGCFMEVNGTSGRGFVTYIRSRGSLTTTSTSTSTTTTSTSTTT